MDIHINNNNNNNNDGNNNNNNNNNITHSQARIRLLPVRTALSPHPSLAGELASCTSGKIDEV